MAIAITIKPQHLCNICNGIKDGEVRVNENLHNAIRNEMVGKGKATIYAICSKSGKLLMAQRGNFKGFELINTKDYGDYVYTNVCECLNGKVVCKFDCEKVECIYTEENGDYALINASEETLLKIVCLTFEELSKYLGKKSGYVIRISNLKIFDKAKELKELKKVGFKEMLNIYNEGSLGDEKTWLKVKDSYSIKKAPQNFVYVEDTL